MAPGYVAPPLVVPAATTAGSSGRGHVVPVLLDAVGNPSHPALIQPAGNATVPALLVSAATAAGSSGPVYVVPVLLDAVAHAPVHIFTCAFPAVYTAVTIGADAPRFLYVVPTILVPAASGTDGMPRLHAHPLLYVPVASVTGFAIPVASIVSLEILALVITGACVNAMAPAVVAVVVIQFVFDCDVDAMDIDDPDYPMADETA
ncbi:hypothetical protein GSI_08553 [Ganoderma sinense ZZ0214-1]|uniref:Uncharacterized protein n=1 Tax=Ganoderma sinense ZZ0214-1 TaxID=1077348 RepID=A0A2G8S447_9APHY|nr:hypothetical protein GSI_08553 [Ganoderma sinense ZZ0214-1]